MTIQGFQIKFSGFNFPPNRNEVTAMLKREIEFQSPVSSPVQWKAMSFKQKCEAVQNILGVNAFYVDAVRGSYLSNC